MAARGQAAHQSAVETEVAAHAAHRACLGEDGLAGREVHDQLAAVGVSLQFEFHRVGFSLPGWLVLRLALDVD